MVSMDSNLYHQCMITSVLLQEVDNLTREKIEDELNELKEAHAADEGAFLSFSILISIYWSNLSLLKKAWIFGLPASRVYLN